jgi:hypothetical protein
MTMGVRRSSTVFVFCGVAAAVMAAATTGTARADPQFPDFATFNAVDIHNYVTDPNGNVVSFSTPDGLNCNFDTTLMMKDETTNQSLNCLGTFPGVDRKPPQDNWCESNYVTAGGSFTYRFSTDQVSCDHPPSRPGKLLPVGSKISAGNVTCAVASGSLTACLDLRGGQRHGFVLQPSGSGAF